MGLVKLAKKEDNRIVTPGNAIAAGAGTLGAAVHAKGVGMLKNKGYMRANLRALRDLGFSGKDAALYYRSSALGNKLYGGAATLLAAGGIGSMINRAHKAHEAKRRK